MRTYAITLEILIQGHSPDAANNALREILSDAESQNEAWYGYTAGDIEDVTERNNVAAQRLARR